MGWWSTAGIFWRNNPYSFGPFRFSYALTKASVVPKSGEVCFQWFDDCVAWAGRPIVSIWDEIRVQIEWMGFKTGLAGQADEKVPMPPKTGREAGPTERAATSLAKSAVRSAMRLIRMLSWGA